MCRSEAPINEDLKRKISNLCDVDENAVINAADARNIYELPLILHDEGLDTVALEVLRMEGHDIDLSLLGAARRPGRRRRRSRCGSA